MKSVKPALSGALFLTLLALTAGCADAPDEDQIVSLEPAQDSDGSPAAREDSQDSAEEGTPDSVEEEFGSEYAYADGLTVSLSGIERRVSGEWDMPEDTPYVYFDVRFDNATGGAVDLTYLSLYCQVGEEGRTAEDVYTDDTGTGFTSAVMDGRTATAAYGCALPEEESYLQVELTLSDWEEMDDYVRETVYFVGDVA